MSEYVRPPLGSLAAIAAAAEMARESSNKAKTDIESLDTVLIFDLARRFLDDVSADVFTDEVLRPFTENAAVLHPHAGDRRLAAITAMCAMESRGWHDGARGIRESIQMGLL